MKKTITIEDIKFNIIKQYCDDNGLKINWFTEKVLLDYIKHNFKNFRSDIVNIKYELYGHINNEYHVNDDIYNNMYLFYKKLCKIVSYYIDIVT
jgi:hypothetical protein